MLACFRRNAPRLAVAVGLVVWLTASSARADVSSWLFTGAGPSWVRKEEGDTRTQATWLLETGMGTDPGNPIVVGALGRLQLHLGTTTDLALSWRTATRDYVNGDWGLALDLGAYQRLSEDSRGLLGSLVLGGPWGITVTGSGGWGPSDSYLVSAVFGIDFARLTVYRTTGASWWKNPFPAHREED
jgi:hypothetical protein